MFNYNKILLMDEKGNEVGGWFDVTSVTSKDFKMTVWDFKDLIRNDLKNWVLDSKDLEDLQNKIEYVEWETREKLQDLLLSVIINPDNIDYVETWLNRESNIDLASVTQITETEGDDKIPKSSDKSTKTKSKSKEIKQKKVPNRLEIKRLARVKELIKKYKESWSHDENISKLYKSTILIKRPTTYYEMNAFDAGLHLEELINNNSTSERVKKDIIFELKKNPKKYITSLINIKNEIKNEEQIKENKRLIELKEKQRIKEEKELQKKLDHIPPAVELSPDFEKYLNKKFNNLSDKTFAPNSKINYKFSHTWWKNSMTNKIGHGDKTREMTNEEIGIYNVRAYNWNRIMWLAQPSVPEHKRIVETESRIKEATPEEFKQLMDKLWLKTPYWQSNKIKLWNFTEHSTFRVQGSDKKWKSVKLNETQLPQYKSLVNIKNWETEPKKVEEDLSEKIN